MAPAARIWEAVMAVADRNDHVSGRASGRKEKIVHARFSAAEFVAIEQAAVAADMTASGFMRSLTLEGAGVKPFLGVNLNRIGRAASRRQDNRPEEEREVIDDVHRVLAALLIELGLFAERGARMRGVKA
jgi:hypothetical protein